MPVNGVEEMANNDEEENHVLQGEVNDFLRNMRHGKSLPPPLYPRSDFHLLVFPDDVTLAERNVWKNKFQQKLKDDVSMPSGHKWWFKNVYVRREKHGIIEELKNGVYGKIHFISKDKPRRRYREFIIRGFPNTCELEELQERLSGISDNIYRLYRMKYNDKATDSIKMIWKSDDENPPEILPLFSGTTTENNPVLVFEPMKMRQPKCYNCNEIGHIARHCSNSQDANGADSDKRRNSSKGGRRATEYRRQRCTCDTDNEWDCTCSVRLQRSRNPIETPTGNDVYNDIAPINQGSPESRDIASIERENSALKRQCAKLQKGMQSMENRLMEKLEKMHEELRKVRREKEEMKSTLANIALHLENKDDVVGVEEKQHEDVATEDEEEAEEEGNEEKADDEEAEEEGKEEKVDEEEEKETEEKKQEHRKTIKDEAAEAEKKGEREEEEGEDEEEEEEEEEIIEEEAGEEEEEEERGGGGQQQQFCVQQAVATWRSCQATIASE